MSAQKFKALIIRLFAQVSLFLFTGLIMLTCKPSASQESFTQYADPFIGTGGHGHTYPGATLPFGMVQLSPDTRLSGWDGCSGYHYSDSIIYGFSHTHLSGTGVSDYGDILFMPISGIPQLQNGATNPDEGYASRFSHDHEKAEPGFYQVLLQDYGINVELTATTRAGFHRYTFSSDAENGLVIDLSHRDKVLKCGLRIVSDYKIEGFRISNAWAKEQHIYFVAEFSQPFIDSRIEKDGIEQKDSLQLNGTDLKAWFSFGKEKEILLKVGISSVSIEGARQNLKAEIPAWDFEKTRKEAKGVWEKALGKIEVKGGSKVKKRIFYTALYHTMLAPNIFSDVDGKYRGMDLGVHQAAQDATIYTVFSLWDTFRATHPLFTIIEQERSKDFLRTFSAQYRDGGILPIWELSGNYTGCMIGYHAIPVIADAWIKGLVPPEIMDTLYAAMKHSANQEHLGLRSFLEKGYIPAGEEAESVSKTLEYAYDDWCIAQIAKLKGEEEDYKAYLQRSQNWKNVFDPQTRFMRAKLNESWFSPFDPYEVNFNYTEANAWQYRFFVPHDINSLVEAMGGPLNFEDELDSMFNADLTTSGRNQADITGLIGQYAHGNEPSHHMAYLYHFIGEPLKTQKRVRQIMDEMYSDQPDGLSGNEDCGQMSAWLVMSAMGFYPVTPGHENYVPGLPWFDEVKVNLENGKSFSISVGGGLGEGDLKAYSLFDSEEKVLLFLHHSELMKGGKWEFRSDKSSQLGWPDFTNSILEKEAQDHPITPVPYIAADGRTFTDSIILSVLTVSPDHDIYIETGDADSSWSLYSHRSKIVLSSSSVIRARAKSKHGWSKTIEAHFYKIPAGRSIQLNSSYANQYSAGGNNALIDYQRGGANFRTGSWQGYREDFEAIIDLGKVQNVNRIGVGFLQDIQSWIWMPSQVEFAISNDGQKFMVLKVAGTGIADDIYGAKVTEVAAIAGGKAARFVRIRARNFGKCPDWHLGAGGKTWLFLDEIIIE